MDTQSIRPYVEEAIAAFGVERCMFASNFPVDKLFSSYDAIFDAFKEITAGLFADGSDGIVPRQCREVLSDMKVPETEY